MGLEKHPVLVSKKLSGLGLGLGLEACGLDYNTGVRATDCPKQFNYLYKIFLIFLRKETEIGL